MNNLTDKINEIEGASKNLEALLRNRTIASRQTRALNKDLRNILSNMWILFSCHTLYGRL